MKIVCLKKKKIILMKKFKSTYKKIKMTNKNYKSKQESINIDIVPHAKS